MGKKFFRVFLMMFALLGAAFMTAGYEAQCLLAAPAVVLDTQTMVWLHSLREEYEKIDTWLSHATDLSSFAEDGQTLIFPEGGAAPAVYVNRTTDVDSVEPTETVYKVSLDVYDSQNYKLRNIYLHALPFDKIQFYTRKSSEAIIKQEVEDAAHAFAPPAAGPKIVVVGSTGPANAMGLQMLTLEDIITLARRCDREGFPTNGRHLVLPSDMWWDLVTNNVILKGQMERMQMNGVLKPLIVEYYGFKIHKSEQALNIGYDTDAEEKAPQGTVITGDVVPAGFLFVTDCVFRASGQMLMFNKAFAQNTEGRAYEFGFQHRFKSGYQLAGQRYSGLVYQTPYVAPSGD
jgi:hypothetical protein